LLLPDFGATRPQRIVEHMRKTLNLAVIAMALAGCAPGQNMIVLKDSIIKLPPPPKLQVGNNLAMPPDLQLAAPAQTVEAYKPNVGTGEGAYKDLQDAAAKAPPPTAPRIFADYGIPLSDENGKPKSPDRLQKELKAAKLARKKKLNPDYGTIKNFRNMFKDQ
jgi:hypothetical protein